MNYQSYWKRIPLDIIYEEILFMDPLDIEKFCIDPYINEKVCQDEYGWIWKKLWQRDLSDTIVLEKNESVKSQYLRDIKNINKLSGVELLKFIAKSGYEKNLYRINLSEIPIEEFEFDDIFYEVLNSAPHPNLLPIVKFFIQNGASVQPLDNFPLKFASKNGYLDIVKYLVEQGADIHDGGEEALQNAAKYGYLTGNWGVAEYLISIGANLIEAYRYSRYEGDTDMVRGLIKFMCNLGLPCDNDSLYKLL